MTQEKDSGASEGSSALGDPVTQGKDPGASEGSGVPEDSMTHKKDPGASEGSDAPGDPVRPRRRILSETDSWDLFTWVKALGIFITALGTVVAIVTAVRVPRAEVQLPPLTSRGGVLVPGVVDNAQQAKLERQFRTEGFRQRNGHCTEPTYPLFSFYASDGWTIDRASVEVRCHESSESTCNGVRDVTERSFNYSCTVANSGFCIPPFVRDGRGACWGEIKWTEQRVIGQQSDSRAGESNCDEATMDESNCPEGTVIGVQIVH